MMSSSQEVCTSLAQIVSGANVSTRQVAHSFPMFLPSHELSVMSLALPMPLSALLQDMARHMLNWLSRILIPHTRSRGRVLILHWKRCQEIGMPCGKFLIYPLLSQPTKYSMLSNDFTMKACHGNAINLALLKHLLRVTGSSLTA